VRTKLVHARSSARGTYVKDLGGFGSASGSIPARIDAPARSSLSVFKQLLGKRRIGSGRMAGAQHENPLAQQPPSQVPEIAVRLAFAALACATAPVCLAFN
jgi:hypothetical protein